jgi:CheY-like chemotaxis protein
MNTTVDSEKTPCETILVIEDDEPIRSLIQHALELEGYTILVAGDGKEGLELLRKVHRPCLILLDLMLPVMNGWEFLEELKRNKGDMLATIPVIITSAAGQAAVSAGQQAQGYIKKPIDLDLLLNQVAKFCGTPEAPPFLG